MEHIDAADVVIVEGILLLVDQDIRDLLDMKKGDGQRMG